MCHGRVGTGRYYATWRKRPMFPPVFELLATVKLLVITGGRRRPSSYLLTSRTFLRRAGCAPATCRRLALISWRSPADLQLNQCLYGGRHVTDSIAPYEDRHLRRQGRKELGVNLVIGRVQGESPVAGVC